MEFLTVVDVARETRLGRATVYELIAEGKLPHVRFGRSIRIPRDALDDFLRKQIRGATADLA